MSNHTPRNRSRKVNRKNFAYLECLENRLLLSAINTANITFSTYFGGTNHEGIDGPIGVAIDSHNNKLIGGWTESSDLPLATNASEGADVEGYVAKFDENGALQWSTYINGDDTTEVEGITVDSAGNALVTGFTDASDLAGALNSPMGGTDAFLAKISPDGTLLWSLYLGGSSDDRAETVVMDASGNSYITGWTQSSDFTGANGTYSAGKDAFVAKVNADGVLQWATYFGGTGDDITGGIAANANGETLITGTTTSKTLPNANNAFHGGSSDAFLAKFDASGSEQWVTFVGGSGSETLFNGHTNIAGAVAWDTDGTAVVTGFTTSTNLPLAKNKYNGGGDGFVSKFDSNGTLLWSDYLGGGNIDLGVAVTVDSQHNVLVAGGINLPSQTNFAPMNAMIAKISPSGALDWMDQFGGSKGDYAASIFLDADGNAWIGGNTSSSDLPEANNTAPGGTFQQDPDPSSPFDAFLAEITASSLSQPGRLAIAAPPSSIIAGTLPAITVQVQFASGGLVNNDSSNITITLLAANGATLGGATSIAAIDGIATFNNLSIDQIGTYTLVASDNEDGLKTVTSSKFTIIPDASDASLALHHPTTAALVGKPVTPAIVLQAQDQFGNPITSLASSTVTLGINTGPNDATLTGTTAVLKNGLATFSKVIFSTAGAYTLSPTDASLLGPTSTPFAQTIIQGTTAIPPLKPARSYVAGKAFTLVANFKSNAPATVPFTGTATFVDQSQTVLGTATLSAAGVATFSLNFTGGQDTGTVEYPGDANHSAATSSMFTLLVQKSATVTTLVPSASELLPSQTLTLTATVNAAQNPLTVRTGSIIFADAGTPLSTLTLDGASSASLSLVPTAGVHSYTASYSGDPDFLASQSKPNPASVNLSPTSIAGDTLLLQDLAGTDHQGPPALSLSTIAASGNTLANTDLVDNTNHTYKYTYKQTGALTATIVATASSGGKTVSITVQLTFQTNTTGTNHIIYSTGGTVDGTFVLLPSSIPATAPTTLTPGLFTLTASAGAGLLSSSGTTHLTPAVPGNSYTLIGISGSSFNSFGTYAYSLVNPSIAAFAYNDSTLGTGTLFLTYTSANAGVYYNVDDNNDWQSGTFTFAAPT